MAFDDEWTNADKVTRRMTQELYEKNHGKESYYSIDRSGDVNKLADFISCFRHVVTTIGPGPHDLLGKTIKVKDRVAVAALAGRSADMLVGNVLGIDPQKGIQVEATERTYGTGSRPINWYSYSERMIVL